MRLTFEPTGRQRRSRFDCSGDTEACVRVLVQEGGVWASRGQADAIVRAAPVETRVAGSDRSGQIFIALAR